MTRVWKAIKANPTVDVTNSYIPLQHQYKGLRVDEHPELLKDKEWANATYKGDCVGVATSDVCLVTYIPEEEDVGVGVELGMAESLGKTKPGIIGEVDRRKDTCNVFLDDILAAIVASAESYIANKNPQGVYKEME